MNIDTIKEWPLAERPREKLLKQGEHTLSNAELLAILLRTGVKGQSAIGLARRILGKFGTFRNMSHTGAVNWREFKGLGPAKIAQIKAALEIGRRFREDECRELRERLSDSAQAAALLMPRMRDLKTEIFKVIFLDSQNRMVAIEDLEEGTVNQASPIIREIFKRALEHFAVAVICAHNHPSGEPAPSREDKLFTQKLVEAGRTLQITVLDHIIIGDNRYYSFADEGRMG
jgi:DNA repair protein RadC